MLETGDSGRDLVGFVLPETGGLAETADPARPYALLDADGAVVVPVEAFFAELQAYSRPATTVRSYRMDLLWSWRFLSGWGAGIGRRGWKHGTWRARASIAAVGDGHGRADCRR
ncbi:hypothetical protein [Streptomyces sp. OE57]|uniref:hypothetical protein n=1 Tax=Streptomyces lacaronensis TaxID=3379885 RepID=UPI0039B75CB3